MKCKHNRSEIFCCKCNYEKRGHHHESPDFENPRDLVDELKKTSNYRKLKEYYEMIYD